MKRLLTLVVLLIPGLGWSEHIHDYTAKLAIGDWDPGVDEIVSALDYLKHDLVTWDKDAKAFPFREYRYQYYGVTKIPGES